VKSEIVATSLGNDIAIEDDVPLSRQIQTFIEKLGIRVQKLVKLRASINLKKIETTFGAHDRNLCYKIPIRSDKGLGDYSSPKSWYILPSVSEPKAKPLRPGPPLMSVYSFEKTRTQPQLRTLFNPLLLVTLQGVTEKK